MMRLYKNLAVWEEAKLITAKQSAAIWEYEQNKCSGYVKLAFLLLGVFCLGLGIISIIASNWEVIPGFVKLIACFILLALPLSAAYDADLKQRSALFEMMLFASFLMVGATIGLVGQVYHLNADFAKGALAWAFISLPIVVLSGKIFLPMLWVPLLLTGLPFWNLFRPLLNVWEKAPYSVTLLVGLVFAVLAFISRFVHKTYPEFAFPKAVFAWSIIALYGAFTLGDIMVRNSWDVNYIIVGFKSMALILPFLGIMTLISYYTEHLKSFYANVVFIGIYVFSLYVTTFFSLATTGIGLILSGLLIIGLVVMFHQIVQAVRQVGRKEVS